MKKIVVIHGPNINLTGKREPGTYGKDSFEAINRKLLPTQKLWGWSVPSTKATTRAPLLTGCTNVWAPAMALF